MAVMTTKRRPGERMRTTKVVRTKPVTAPAPAPVSVTVPVEDDEVVIDMDMILAMEAEDFDKSLAHPPLRRR